MGAKSEMIRNEVFAVVSITPTVLVQYRGRTPRVRKDSETGFAYRNSLNMRLLE